MKSRAFSLVEIVIALAVLSALGSVAYVQVANTRQAADAAKLVSDVEAINRAIPLYATFGGSFSQDDDADTVLRKLKTRRNSTNANTSPGLVENFLDPRVMPEWQSGHEAGTSRERAVLVWDTPRHMPRFEIVSSGTAGIKKFVFDETQTVAFASALDGDAAHRENRSDFLLASDRTSKTGKWVWEYTNSLPELRDQVVNPDPGVPPSTSAPSDPDHALPTPTPMPTPIPPDPPDEEEDGGGGGGGTSLPRGALVGSIYNDGIYNGDIIIRNAQDIRFNGSARVNGNIYFPGTPNVIVKNGSRPVVDLQGSEYPSGYKVELDTPLNVSGTIFRRFDPPDFPIVEQSPAATSSQSKTFEKNEVATIGATQYGTLLLRNGSGPKITLIGGTQSEPAKFGNITVDTGTIILGVEGATIPSYYTFNELSLKNQSVLKIVGPVVISVNKIPEKIYKWGEPGKEEWLTINVFSGDVNIERGDAQVYGRIIAPNSNVYLNGTFNGSVVAKHLKVNGSGVVFTLAPGAG